MHNRGPPLDSGSSSRWSGRGGRGGSLSNGLGFISPVLSKRTLLKLVVNVHDPAVPLLFTAVGRVQGAVMTDRRPAYMHGLAFEDGRRRSRSRPLNRLSGVSRHKCLIESADRSARRCAVHQGTSSSGRSWPTVSLRTPTSRTRYGTLDGDRRRSGRTRWSRGTWFYAPTPRGHRSRQAVRIPLLTSTIMKWTSVTRRTCLGRSPNAWSRTSMFVVDGTATVAMLDPLNLQAIDQIPRGDEDGYRADARSHAEQLRTLITRAYSRTPAPKKSNRPRQARLEPGPAWCW